MIMWKRQDSDNWYIAHVEGLLLFREFLAASVSNWRRKLTETSEPVKVQTR